MVDIDQRGLEAAVRECARITAPEVTDEEFERERVEGSSRYLKTREEMSRTIGAYLSAQQREPVVRVPKFSVIMHQIALWSDDEGLDLSTGQGDALTRRIMAAIEIQSSDGGVEGHARYASQAHPALGCKDGRNGVPDTNAKPVAGIKPGLSETIADVSVEELEAFIGSLEPDSMAVARALLSRFRIERLDRLASSGRR